MPRLAVDEPPQHGTATGTYVDNAALAARRTASKKRPSPSTGSGSGSGPTKKTKTRQFPSPRSQAEIAVIHTQNMALPKKKRRTASKALADVLKAPRNGQRKQTGPEIKIFGQEPNSPCTNTNDLGFYNSMDSRLPQYRKFKLDDFEKQVDECYWAYPPEKLTALFDSKKRVCGAIITAGGRNDFALPHKREKRACDE
jgi:hypothetical protein